VRSGIPSIDTFFPSKELISMSCGKITLPAHTYGELHFGRPGRGGCKGPAAIEGGEPCGLPQRPEQLRPQHVGGVMSGMAMAGQLFVDVWSCSFAVEPFGLSVSQQCASRDWTERSAIKIPRALGTLPPSLIHGHALLWEALASTLLCWYKSELPLLCVLERRPVGRC
jgi:hypothetical protein